MSPSEIPQDDLGARESPDLAFGPFALIRRGEALYRDGQQVKLGSRARQILSMLAQNAGRLVTKDELMARVWPDTVVVDANLTVHIAALRQALGESRDGPLYIVNIAGRGYRFVAPVHPLSSLAALPAESQSNNNLPARLIAPIGCEIPLAELDARLAASRLVTIAGPAGVGKTTLALLAAEGRLGRHAGGIWFIDLAPLTEDAHVASTVAQTLHIELGADTPLDDLTRHLSDRGLLLILDNCEHVIEAAADLVAAIGAACPTVSILATSREPLNVAGEAVFQLHPLAVPPPTMMVGAREALAFPAVQLLAARAADSSSDFELDDQNALGAALICRRLDGLPLAIEFAAALVGTYGLNGIANRLDEHLRLLDLDRRGGALRHRTLEAALDWSYQLLDADEQRALRRLAIFSGGFTMEAAERVIPAPGEAIEVGALLASLVRKSLVGTDIAGPDLRFRVLETTRAFALARLEAAGEKVDIAGRHARYFRDYLQAQHLTFEQRDVANDAAEIDNIRAALRHALGPEGDTDVALGLAAGALPIWFGLSLLTECHQRVREVQARLSPDQHATTEGWNLAVATRTAEMFTHGTRKDRYLAWQRAPDAAGGETNAVPSVADMLTNWTWNLRLPNYGEMMRLATAHAGYARANDTEHDRIMSAWVLGLSAHHLGDLVAARGHLRRFLALETVEDRRVFLGHTGFDRRPGAQAMLAATLCQLGETAAGLAMAEAAEAESRATGKALPMCEGMMWVCAAMLIGQAAVEAVEMRLEELVEVAEARALDSHVGVALGLRGLCRARQGDYAAAEDMSRRALALISASHYGPFTPWFVGARAHALAQLGNVAEALEAIERFRAADINGDSWCSAELMRHEALVRHAAGTPPADIVACFDAAADLAGRQSARAFAVESEISRAASIGRDEARWGGVAAQLGGEEFASLRMRLASFPGASSPSGASPRLTVS